MSSDYTLENLGWGAALRSGQRVVSEDGECRVIQFAGDSMSLVSEDESWERHQLRWMLWHHVRDLLRPYSEFRAEFFDWPGPAVVGTAQILQAESSKRRGSLRIVLPKKAKSLSRRDYHPSGKVDREPLFRVVKCHQLMGKPVEVWRRTGKRALYHLVNKCGSYTQCPICSHRIVMGRREELKQAFEALTGRGGMGYLVTLTVPHSPANLLEDLLRQVLYARELLNHSGWAKRVDRKPGKRSPDRLGHKYLGRIRALEITWSLSGGWHPHLHELWVFSSELTDIELSVFSDLPSAWGDCCESWWLGRPSAERGVDVRRIVSNVDYLAKFGVSERRWGLEKELASSGHKTKSHSPWSLLELSMFGDEIARGKFLEYVRAMYAVQPSAIHISQNLNYAIKQLGLTLRDDDTLSKVVESEAELLMELSVEDYRFISANGLHSLILRLAETGGPEVVRNFINSKKGV